VLIVAEALHDGAAADVRALVDTLAHELRTLWGLPVRSALLSSHAPRFECA